MSIAALTSDEAGGTKGDTRSKMKSVLQYGPKNMLKLAKMAWETQWCPRPYKEGQNTGKVVESQWCDPESRSFAGQKPPHFKTLPSPGRDPKLGSCSTCFPQIPAYGRFFHAGITVSYTILLIRGTPFDERPSKIIRKIILILLLREFVKMENLVLLCADMDCPCTVCTGLQPWLKGFARWHLFFEQAFLESILFYQFFRRLNQSTTSNQLLNQAQQGTSPGTTDHHVMQGINTSFQVLFLKVFQFIVQRFGLF
jgi:hypothetical protein